MVKGRTVGRRGRCSSDFGRFRTLLWTLGLMRHHQICCSIEMRQLLACESMWVPGPSLSIARSNPSSTRCTIWQLQSAQHAHARCCFCHGVASEALSRPITDISGAN